MPAYWKRKARVDIVPLIDVLVILVFFFLIYGSFDEGAGALPVNLPGSSTAPLAETGRFIVSLDKDGRYSIDGHPVEPTGLPSAVATALLQEPNRQVVLFPDGEVPYEALVGALDLLREGGAERPALGVKRENEREKPK